MHASRPTGRMQYSALVWAYVRPGYFCGAHTNHPFNIPETTRTHATPFCIVSMSVHTVHFSAGYPGLTDSWEIVLTMFFVVEYTQINRVRANPTNVL